MDELGEGTPQPVAQAASGRPTDSAPGSRLRLGGVPPAAQIGALSVVLVLLTIVVYVAALRSVPSPVQPFGVPITWPMLAVGFFLAEMRVIDVSFRREKHSFSLSEFPAVMGFFLLSPPDYFIAILAGTAMALLLARQRPVKFVLNLASYALTTAVSLAIFHAFPQHPGVPQPIDWIAAFAATSAAAVLSSFTIATAITLSGGAPQFEKLPEMIQFGLLVAVANTSLALLAVSVLWTDPVQIALLGVPLIAIFLAYRAYQTEHERHERLDLLYQSSRILQHSPELEPAVSALLEHTREMFRAQRAEILLASREPDADVLVTEARHDGAATAMAPTRPADVNPLHLRVLREPSAFLFSGNDSSLAGVRQAMAAPLIGDEGVAGSILVINRLTEATGYNNDDLRLLETLANQTAVALQNGQLEQSLNELSRLKEELRFQAYHDPLTGLANRALFTEQVDAALEAQHDGMAPVVLFVDLDDFKDVNDSLGHASGDQLLIAVAERVRNCVRAEDTAARLGGDEFAVLLLDDRRLERALAVATRLIDALAATVPVAGQNLKVSASIGIAAGRVGTRAEELLRNADVAMYTAKQGGKNSFSVFEPTMHASIVARHALSTDLARGVADGEIVVHYQPLISLASGLPYGAEALARWRHPVRGIIPPEQFIKLAEESGSIIDLGRQVLFDACRAATEWQTPGEPKVTVNVSAAQLRRDSFVHDVVDALRMTGLSPTSLVLEMTETVMFHDVDATISRLSALREIGIGVAIDDFGTGFSSLGYLRQFPVDILKIAREFVPPDDSEGDAWAFASAIVALGTTLQLRIVAEGIETRGQLDRLRLLGCEFGQGFLFGRPMPEADIAAFLAGRRSGPAVAVGPSLLNASRGGVA